MTNAIFFTIIGILVVCFMGYIWYTRGDRTEYTTEFVTDEDSPQLKFESQCRANYHTLVLSLICQVWHMQVDDKHVQMMSLGFNHEQVVVSDNDIVFTVDCDWDKQRMLLSVYSDGEESDLFWSRSCRFSLRGNHLDMTRIREKLQKWYNSFFKDVLTARADNLGGFMSMAESLSEQHKFSDKEVLELFVELFSSARKRPSAVEDAYMAAIFSDYINRHPDIYQDFRKSVLEDEPNETPQ